MSVKMESPQGSLSDFLASAKRSLKDGIKNKGKVTLVIGNEKADTDSIVSAILFSYFRSGSPPTRAFTPIYIPLAQLSEEEIASRPALSRLLAQAGLHPSDLITLEDILKSGDDKQSGLVADNTRIFLVNQNKLLGRMGENYSKNIIGCIDNHDEEDYVPKDTGPEPRIIGKAATSTSLVVNHAHKTWETLSDSDGGEWDSELAKLGLGAVLLDTENMGASNSKLTKEDESAVEFLESKIASGPSGASFNRSEFYSALTKDGAKGPQQGTAREMPIRGPINTTGVAVASAPPLNYTTTGPASKATVTDTTELLPVWLASGFAGYPSTGGTVIGISTVERSLPALIDQSERDVAHRAINASAGSTTSQPSTTGSTIASGEIKAGSPFTALVRNFAQSKGCSIFGLMTTSDANIPYRMNSSSNPLSGDRSGSAPSTAAPTVGQSESASSTAVPTVAQTVTSTITSFFSGSKADSATTSNPRASTQSNPSLTRDTITGSASKAPDDSSTGISSHQTPSGPDAQVSASALAAGKKELFLWVLEPSLSAVMPSFVSRFSAPLELERWEGEEHEIVKEMGMYDGMMRVYWVGAKDAGSDIIAGMVGECL